MEIDLLKTKEELLIDQCKIWGYFSSHQVMQWGLDNFYIRADRTKRDLVEKGILRKLSNSEKMFRGFKCKDGIYEYIGK